MQIIKVKDFYEDINLFFLWILKNKILEFNSFFILIYMIYINSNSEKFINIFNPINYDLKRTKLGNN